MELIEILKFNPNHGKDGKFAVVSGAASKLVSNRPARSNQEIIHAAIPNAKDQAEYAQKSKAVHEAFAAGKTTRNANRVDGKYTKARLRLHQDIINHMLGDTSRFKPEEGQKPRAVLLGGRGGSGKSNFDQGTNPEVGVYNRHNTLVLNSDRIKELLPEYTPETAALTHHESADILSKAVQKAKNLGLNTALDLTMARSAKGWVDAFKKAGYEVHGAYIHRPEDLAAESAVSRWSKPDFYTDLQGTPKFSNRGRLVPVSVVRQSKSNEANFDKLTPHLDKWVVFNNSEKNHRFEKVAEGGKKQASEILAIDCTDFLSILKFDPYHDPHTGKFTTGVFSTSTYGDANHVATNSKVKKHKDDTASDVFYNGKKIGEVKKGWSHWQNKHVATEYGFDGYSNNQTNAVYSLAKKHVYYLMKHPEFNDLTDKDVLEHTAVGAANKAGIAPVKVDGKGIGFVQARPDGKHVGVHGPTENYTESYPTHEQALSAIAQLHADYLNSKPQEATPVGPSEEDISKLKGAVKTHTPGGWITQEKTEDHGDGTKTLHFKHYFYSGAKGQEALPAVHKMYEGTGAAITNKNSYFGVSVKVGQTAVHKPAPVEDLHKILHPAPGSPNEVNGKILTPAQQAALAKAKAKTQAAGQEKAKAELAEKYPKLQTEANILNSNGKHSGAAAKINQIETIKKKMAQYGMLGDEIKAEVDKQKEVLFEKQKAVQEKAHELAYAHAMAYAPLSGKVDGGYVGWQDQQNPALMAAAKAFNDHVNATAGMHGANTYSSYMAAGKQKVAYQKDLALNKLSHTIHEGAPHSEVESAELEAKAHGAGPKEISLAFNTHFGHAGPATNLEEAESVLKKAVIDHHEHKSVELYEPYSESKETNKQNTFKAKQDLVAAKDQYLKHGGTEAQAQSILESPELKQQGYIQYDKKKNAKKYAQADLKNAIIEAGKTYAYNKKKFGEDHADTVKAQSELEKAKQAATSHPEYPLDDNAVTNSEVGGKTQGQSKYYSEQEEAIGKVSQAAYAYYMAKSIHGEDHPDTQKALGYLSNSIDQNREFVSADRAEQIHEQSEQAANKVKELLEKTKAMGPVVQDRISQYEAQAPTFQFPKDSSKSDEYYLQSLPQDQKQVVSSYTGSGYKGMNKGAAALERGDEIDTYVKKAIGLMDKATENGVIDENMLVTRSFPASHFYDALNLGYDASDEHVKATEGALFHNAAFTSSSMDSQWSSAFAHSTSTAGTATMKIRVLKGMPGIRYGGGESEVILPRGMNYLIRKATKTSNGKLLLEVDAINNTHGDV